MLPQISATVFFCFGISVLTIGYLIVEIIWGENYFWRNELGKYKQNLFDRIIHYIIRGIVFNFLILIISHYIKGFPLISDLITSSGKIAEIGFKFDPNIVINIQMIAFCIQYFIIVLVGLFMTWILISIIRAIFGKKKRK